MNNLYLFQVQERTDFGKFSQYWIPYSVGCLWAYAQQFDSVTSSWNLKDIIFKRLPLDELIDQLEEPDLCAFSVYVWNRLYCLSAAQRIKEKWPNCIIVFGGPEVSGNWLKYEFADCLVLGEGEISFKTVLETAAKGQKLQPIVQTERMASLDEIPSPYVVGVFDKMVQKNPGVFWQAPFETNRGCPYSCTFCDWGGLTQSKIKKFKLERIAAEIDWMSKNNVKTIFIADANFGIFKERDVEIAKMLRQWIDKNNGLEYISMNYAKNSNKLVFEIAKILGTTNKGITFSVQSMNSDTLKVIKRQNMDTNNVAELMKLAKENDVHFYTELMLGLPLETLESWKAGTCELLELGQHYRIEIMPVVILENTELNNVQKSQYNLHTIPVSQNLAWAVDESGIVEVYDVVKSTNTMTTNDLVEAFLYTWMIVNLHMANYSQILSKYHRFVNNITYRQFYDHLFQKLQNGGDTILHHHYNRVKLGMTNVYTYGETKIKDLYLGIMQHDAAFDFYKNLPEVLEFTISAAQELGHIDPGVIEIQKRTLLNPFYTHNCSVKTSTNIDNWLPEDCEYEISSAEWDIELTYTNFYSRYRRTKKIFNKIKKIS